MESKNSPKDSFQEINFLYKELESNPLITFPKNTQNKLNLDFSLTDLEKKCFKIIQDIISKYKLSSTECRVAGGWVRDKLLSRESIDIDIALNNMKGCQLASLINEELYPGKDKIGIIQQNSEKGKHLETATIKICNFWIDFVNLRSSEDNVIGTPLEDAERRDLSINSLFYNISQKKVEDWTKKGIQDLIDGVIDTPINPEITFHDDPLRILRMLRFALKYKFSISDRINNCLEKNIEKYRYHFNNTISNERIEKELYQILNLNNSSFVIAYLYKYKLLDVILQPYKFLKEEEQKSFDINNKIFLKITNIFILGIYLLEKKKTFEDFAQKNINCSFNKIDFGLLLLTYYFRQMEVKFGKEKITINRLILREILKTANDYIRENHIMLTNIDDLRNLVKDQNFSRLSVGKLIRKIHNNNIIKVLYGSVAIDYIEEIEKINEKEEGMNKIIDQVEESLLEKIIGDYRKLCEFIEKENLLLIDELKPLLDGKEIIQELNVKPGKDIGKLLEMLLEQQIQEPKIDRESAITFLNKKKLEMDSNKKEKDINKEKGKDKEKKNNNGKKGGKKKK